jgi:hypothetical protein
MYEKCLLQGRLACVMTAVSFLAFAIPVSVEAQSSEVRQVTSSCYTPCIVASKGNETVEVILPDATSIVLAPGSRARISRDADGGVIVQIEEGRARIAGGSRNAAVPIQVMTPQAMLSIRDAAIFVSVEGGETRTHLLNGDAVLVSAGGTTRRIYRPGYQSVATSGRVSTPRRMDVEDVVADLMSIAPGLSTGQRPRVTSSVTGSASSPTTGGPVSDDDGVVETAANDVDADEDPFEGGDDPIANEDDDPGPGVVGGTETFDVAGLSGAELDLAQSFAPTISEGSQVTAQQDATINFGNYYTSFQSYDILGSSPGGFAQVSSIGPSTNRVVDDTFGAFALNNPKLYANGQPNDDSQTLVWFSSDSYNAFGYTNSDRLTEQGGSSGIAGPFIFDGTGPFGGSDRVFSSDSVRINFISFNDGSNESFQANSGILGFLPLSVDPIAGGGAYVDGIYAGGVDNFILSEITQAVAYEFPSFSSLLADTEFMADVMASDTCSNSSSCLVPTDIDYNETAFIEDVVFSYLEDEIVAATPGQIEYTFKVPDPDCSGFDCNYTNNFQTAAAVARTTNEGRRFVIATGNLDSLAPGGSVALSVASGEVDRFHLAGSMQGQLGDLGVGVGGVSTGMDHSTGRAFLRGETWTELSGAGALDQLTDTGVILRYPTTAVENDADTDGTGTGGDNAVLLHADIGISGSGVSQVSTMSVTVGSLSYRLAEGEVDGLIEARTVGTSQDAGGSTLAFHNDLHSSAAGGGNQRLDEAPGRLGFFVLENAGTLFDDVAESLGDALVSLNGGREFDLNASTDPTDFALLRIGVGTESASGSALGDASVKAGTVGYAAGFLERANGGSVALARFQDPHDGTRLTEDRSNLSFSDVDAETHIFSATLTAGGETLNFGGDGLSAYINDREFGALSLGSSKALGDTYGNSDYAMAMVSGETGSGSGELRSEVNAALPGPSISRYDHVKWGFFMGDASIGGNRNHVHMASFTAGDRVIMSAETQPNGTAEYSGHALGTVVEGGNSRVVAGSYTDSFNFDTREGNFSLGFDGETHAGTSRLTDATTGPMFYGGGANTDVMGGSLAATVAGEFVSNGGMLETTATGLAPGGLVGSFDIGGTRNGGSYAATGTFGAELN